MNPAPGKLSQRRANNSGADASKDAMIGVVGIAGHGDVMASENAGPGETDDARHCWIIRLMASDGPGILHLLWRILGREADVMDAYQDCFCKLAKLTGKREPQNARAYAYRTASNIAIELIRTRRRRTSHWDNVVATRSQRANDDEPAAASVVTGNDQLREAIGSLPNHLRNVIVLRDLSRMTYDEVGRILGIEPTTARVYRRHAVIQLAKELDAKNWAQKAEN